VGLPVFVVSMAAHECAHGLVALANGDPTARDSGRLTLDPLRHVDLVGSLLVPGVLLALGSPFTAGWARQMPVDRARLREPRNGTVAVALAGPAANVLLAIAFAGIARVAPTGGAWELLRVAAYTGVLCNCSLALFHLLPIPPLDGAWVLSRFLRLRHIVALHQLRVPLALALLLLVAAPTPSRALLLSPVRAAVRACCAVAGVAPPPLGASTASVRR